MVRTLATWWKIFAVNDIYSSYILGANYISSYSKDPGGESTAYFLACFDEKYLTQELSKVCGYLSSLF